MGKILRRERLHHEYGQDGPDQRTWLPALGSAKPENHNNYRRGTEVVFVDCYTDQTVDRVRAVIGDQYGGVIQRVIGNILILDRM